MTNARHNQPVGCANSGAASHCRLIFERLVYTRLVLKKFISRGDTRTESRGGGEEVEVRAKRNGRGGGRGREFGDRVDKAADVIREIQGPSISDERTWPTKHWSN